MRNESFKKVFLLTFLGIFAFSDFVFAANSNGILGRMGNVAGKGGYKVGSDNTQLAQVIGQVINAFFALLGIIFIILILLSGYHWMTARGEQDKIKNAQTTIRNAIIGLIITLSAFAIWGFVSYYLIQK